MDDIHDPFRVQGFQGFRVLCQEDSPPPGGVQPGRGMTWMRVGRSLWNSRHSARQARPKVYFVSSLPKFMPMGFSSAM